MTTADSALRSSGFAVGRLLLPALDSDKIEAAGLGVAGVMADDGSRHREDQSGAVAKEGLRTTVNARAGSGLPAPNGIAAKGRWYSITGCRCILRCLLPDHCRHVYYCK